MEVLLCQRNGHTLIARKLRLTDTIAPRGGTLRSWSITVYGHSGTPTLPAPGTPTPTPDVPTSDDVVRRIHCQPDDFAAAFGEKYDMDDEGLYYYDRNGRGLWETLTTRWVSSSDSGRVVVCRTKVYDNISSAIFDNYYATMADEASGSYDVLRQYKRCCEEIGQAFRGLILNIGQSAAIGDTVQWRDTVSYRVAVSGFRQRQVIVQVAVYDDGAYYINSSDAMARRVESRFNDGIFEQIETRQQGRVGGTPLTEGSLHLAPPLTKP